MNPRHPTPTKGEQTAEKRKDDEREMREDDEVCEGSVEHCGCIHSIRGWHQDAQFMS